MDDRHAVRTGRITYCMGERLECEKILERFFGQIPDESTFFSLAAAPAGAILTVGTDADGLLLDVIEPVRLGLTVQCRICEAQNGEKTLQIDDFRILRRRRQKKGVGTALFAKMLDAASSLGFSHITATVDLSADENGFYTFQRFGFFPAKGEKTSGETRLVFDLAEQSRSMKCFKKYLREKTAR